MGEGGQPVPLHTARTAAISPRAHLGRGIALVLFGTGQLIQVGLLRLP